jgi:endonuclease/exonuclease/phosphatase family metal-dependent hydrolase
LTGRLRAALGLAAALAGCEEPPDAAPVDLTVPADAATTDAATTDAAAAADAAQSDAAGPPDAAGVDAAPADLADAAAPADLGSGWDLGGLTRVRIVAANTTSGNNQSYEQPGIDIFQGLAPDIVLIQEFNYAGGQRALVDVAFGQGFSFYVEPRVGGIPNGVVSRYPILESGVWTDASVADRAFVYARIDVPGPIDLWAVSVHLLTTSAGARATEATQLLGYIANSVPNGDYLVVGGDLNTDAANEQAIVNLSATLVVMPPFPADQNGNTNTSTNRNRPHDWVLARPALDALETPVAIGASIFTDGLVFDSRVYVPLAEVPPVVVTDSAAPGMQHMAVVRDFLFDSTDASDASSAHD